MRLDLNFNPSRLFNLYIYTHTEKGGIFRVFCRRKFCLFYVYVGVWKTLELIWSDIIRVIHDFILLVYVKMTWLNTGCHRRNGPNFGRVFLMLNYTDITQNTYTQS